MKKPVKIESLIKKWQVKTSAETDDRILADALAALENSTACDSLRPERSIIISRLAKLACAAVIVLAGLLGGYYLSTGVNVSSIAWAQVAKEVGRIETFTYHLETDITAGSPSQTHHAETQFFFSSLYGIRLNAYVGGEEKMSMFINLAKKNVLTIIPKEKKYTTMPLSDEYLAKFHKENDPRQLVSRFVSLPYKKLGRDTIEGIEAEAIEVNHPDIAAGMLANAIGRLWVDIENHLPVRMTLEGSAAKKTVRMVMTAREFRWNAELEPSLFEPNIPADFTQAGKVETAQSDEQKAVLSLKLFAQITDGQYPHDLALLSTMQQAGEALSQKDKDLSIAERQKILLSISHVCQFYSQLQDQNIDFGYFGHKIKAEDSDSLLMYWQKSPEQYKVILADLTMKILTPNELANLKIKSEKYTTRKK